jgi:hypothetical protein
VIVAAATALAVVAAAAWFVLLRASGPTGPSVALAVSFSPNHALGYRMSMLMEGHVALAGQQLDLSATLSARASLRPVATDQDGVTTVALRLTHVRLDVNGHRQRSAFVTTKMRISPDGEIRGGEGSLPTGGKSPYVLPGTDQIMPLLPDHPVSVGETWTDGFDRPFPLGEGSIHYSATSRLGRFDVVDGVRTAVVESNGRASMDGITIDLRKALAASGDKATIPASVNPRISFGGGMDLIQTAWIDLQRREMVRFQNYGPFHITMGFEGVPGVPPGDASFDGRFDLSLVRVPSGSHSAA